MNAALEAAKGNAVDSHNRNASIYKTTGAHQQYQLTGEEKQCPHNMRSGTSIVEAEADGDTSSYLQMMNIEVKTSAN